MRLIVALLAALSVATWSLPATAARVQELNRIVAIVDDDVITYQELKDRLETIVAQLRQSKTPLPADNILQRQVLERLIVERLQLKMASRAGIRVDDENLNEVIGKIARDNGLTLAQFRQVLERDGFKFADFREEIRNELTISRLRSRQVESRIVITPQEVENYLAHRQAEGAEGTEYRLEHILIAVPEAARPAEIQAAKARAEELLGRLRSGADFREMAVSYSDGQQALEGGDLGWRKAGQLPTLFSEVALKMAVGAISDPIRSPSGFHILRLAEKRGETKHVVRQTHARHILIRTDAITSDEQARARLLRLRDRILDGEDFDRLARANSDDTGSASQGGDLGWANPGMFVPAFEEAMGKLAPGQVSEPFRSQFGWHIVQVLERRDHDDTEEHIRNQAREALRQRKMEEELENWLRRMRDESYVTIRLDS